MLPAPASNGCSRRKRPAQKWGEPTQTLPKSHNLCAEVLGASARTSAKETVLVVDDDAGVLETTRNMLEELGYKVIAAGDAEAALAAIGAEAIDIAILDLAMPGVPGLDLGQHLQQRQPALPIIYCSGYPDLIEATGKRLSSGLLLGKPYSSRDLSAKIDSILSTKSLAGL
jgi:DNA-binding NtrC family response regulator